MNENVQYNYENEGQTENTEFRGHIKIRKAQALIR
jgi:hypothetical protein